MEPPKKLTNNDLYEQQMRLLNLFLEHGAINQAQYNKSAGDLTRKMFPQGRPDAAENPPKA